MDVVDMQRVTKSMQDYGQDQLVELKLLKPDVVMGLWKVFGFFKSRSNGCGSSQSTPPKCVICI